MTFAHWKNIAPPNGSTGPGGEHIRYIGRDEVAEHFIVDIPEGTTRDDVVAKLVGKLLSCGGQIGATDGMGFEQEWPPEVLRQFQANLQPSGTWTWSSLT